MFALIQYQRREAPREKSSVVTRQKALHICGADSFLKTKVCKKTRESRWKLALSATSCPNATSCGRYELSKRRYELSTGTIEPRIIGVCLGRPCSLTHRPEAFSNTHTCMMHVF